MELGRTELDHAEPNQGPHCQFIIRDLRSSEILRSMEWLYLTNISGQPLSPIFKGQEIQKGEQCTTEVNWHKLKCNIKIQYNGGVLRGEKKKKKLTQSPVVFVFGQIKMHATWLTP
jgi:hypothetical protein